MAMDSRDPVRIGVDVGGTKIEAIALDPDGNTLLRRRVDTPRNDYQRTVQAIYNLVTSLEHTLGRSGAVGIGIPGALSHATRRVKNANSVWLNDRPLSEDLTRLLARPLRFANDANCFTLSEATDGAARGASSVFGAIIGTGVGGGVVVEGRVLNGPNSIAGEWGHNPLPWPNSEESPGPSCYCGKTACIETFLSGPGFRRDFAAHTGIQESPSEIIVRADRGEPEAEAAVLRYEDRMARALSLVINIFDPDVIVLGGGMSNLKRLYSNVPKAWGQFVFSDRVDTGLVPPNHGDSSGVRGAAWLWALEECSGLGEQD